MILESVGYRDEHRRVRLEISDTDGSWDRQNKEKYDIFINPAKAIVNQVLVR